MKDISHTSADLAYQLYRNAYRRSLGQRVFHIIPIAMTTSLVKLAFLRHRFKMINERTFLDIVKNRPAYKPLITISNHYSCLDDIILFGQALPYKLLLDGMDLSSLAKVKLIDSDGPWPLLIFAL